MNRIPTRHQQDVLDSQARIRVVKAAPGSGKTWLVSELIRRELEAWPHRGSGIAALSFTRVGGDEIRKAVGRDLEHPHFVGTIDAFVFRYIVRPFLQRCFALTVMPRLLPDTTGANHWNTFGCVDEWITQRKKGKETTKKNVISVFECQYVGEGQNQDKTPILQQLSSTRTARILPQELATRVREEKRRILKAHGLLTHSDAAFQARCLLLHKQFGQTIRREIIRRFPLLIVDELQDTGYFLGKCIQALLTEPSIRGVLVGDPDQSIFEFTGATPELFDVFTRLDGAELLPLPTSRRCCAKVIAVARHLKDSAGELHPDPNAQGRALLLRYTDMVPDVENLVRTLRSMRQNSVKIVTRANETVDQLRRRASKKGAQKLGSPALTHMHRAVIALRQGRNSSALSYSAAALELASFDAEGLSEDALLQKGIEPNRWKRLVTDTLLAASDCMATGTLYEWQQRVSEVLERCIRSSGIPNTATFAARTIKPQKRGEHAAPASTFLPELTAQPTLAVDTVHAVKGETHDVTVYVCQDTTDTYCPSRLWWSSKEADRERKRIAYVGMTRTKSDLFLCVSVGCFERLRAVRSEFVADFETMTVDEFVIGRA